MIEWIKNFKSKNDIQVRGSGNNFNDEPKEIARLKHEFRDTKDTLDVLKKLQAL